MRVLWSLATALVFFAVGCAPPAADTGASTVVSVPASSTLTTSTDPSPPATASTAAPTTVTTRPTTTTTTTVPGPPRLEVLDPIHGATVTTRRYTFSGATDPDCTVTVGGKYRATVEPDGSWTLDLMLGPGRNSTTFVATDPETGLETRQAIRVYYADLGGLVLQGDGLGVVSFGDPVDDVLAALESHVGEPDVDEIVHREEVGAPAGGACAGGYSCWENIRRAEWSNVGLSLTFSDLWWEPGMEWPYPKAPMSLVAYWVVGPHLSTAEGIGVGASVADLEAAYGPMLTLDTDFDLGPFFSVILDGSDIWFGGAGFHGLLSAAPTDSASAVVSITAGRPSSW